MTSSVVQISHIWNSSSESVDSIAESAAQAQKNINKMQISNPQVSNVFQNHKFNTTEF